MVLDPFTKIIGIDTGNAYIGVVNLFEGQSFFEVAKNFQNHRVFTKSEAFPNSSIFNDSIHVYYSAEGHVIGAEVFSLDSDRNNTIFVYGEINLFPATMQDLAADVQAQGMTVSFNDYGIDIDELGLSYFCSDFEDDLQCRIDCVYVTLKAARS